MDSLTLTRPKNYRRVALVVTALALVIVFALYNIEEISGLLYPLKLLTTYVHEAGHSLAAILTGGRVQEFVVSANTSGYASTAGGWRWLVLPGGYLGTALFGSILFYLINRFPRIPNYLAAALGVGIVVFTVLFARPDESGAPIALFVGVIFGMALLAMGMRAPAWITALVMNVIAVSLALEAFFKLRYLIGNTAFRGSITDDVTAFQQAYAPLVPQSVVAISWVIIAVVMFGIAFYYGALKPLRQEINTSYDNLVR